MYKCVLIVHDSFIKVRSVVLVLLLFVVRKTIKKYVIHTQVVMAFKRECIPSIQLHYIGCPANPGRDFYKRIGLIHDKKIVKVQY